MMFKMVNRMPSYMYTTMLVVISTPNLGEFSTAHH